MQTSAVPRGASENLPTKDRVLERYTSICWGRENGTEHITAVSGRTEKVVRVKNPFRLGGGFSMEFLVRSHILLYG